MNIQQVDLLSVLGWTGMRRWASTNGGEWHGACPIHGGTDTLVVNPTPIDSDRGLWHCRRSDEGGDAIALCQHLHGDTYLEAIKRLDVTPQQGERVPPAPHAIEYDTQPCDAWRKRAAAFRDYAESCLWSDQGKRARDYLVHRGLDLDFCFVAGVGYNPEPLFAKRTAWGLDERLHDDGTPIKLWLPAGIVFPWHYQGEIWKINIRQLQTTQKMKYVNVSGSANLPYGIDWIVPRKPLVIVEGVIDALLVQQHCEGTDQHNLCIASAIAVGTTGGRRYPWITEIGKAVPLLNALDNDASGNEYSAFWQRYPQALRWLTEGKDVGEMAQAGANIRQWVYDGLEAYQATHTVDQATGVLSPAGF